MSALFGCVRKLAVVHEEVKNKHAAGSRQHVVILTKEGSSRRSEWRAKPKFWISILAAHRDRICVLPAACRVPRAACSFLRHYRVGGYPQWQQGE
jgi:hypothetical protein